MIIFDSVTKRFGKRTVLDEINVEIRPGEFVCIVGKSGAGKTTLLKLLLGAEHPSEGAILINSLPMHEFSSGELQRYRRSIGCVFQDYKLLPHKTLFENVAFALEMAGYALHHIIEMATPLIEELRLAHVKDNYPHEVSGGEAQRASFARAIAHKPALILADEPTGNLDTEHEKLILKSLMKLNMRGTTVILTTHNKPLTDIIGQRVLHLENGKLATS